MKEEIISEDLETKSRIVKITEDNGKTFLANKTIRDDEPKKEVVEEVKEIVEEVKEVVEEKPVEEVEEKSKKRFGKR